MANVSVDKSNKEQLVTCLRWVDDNFNAHEDCLCLYEVPNTEAVTKFKAIEDIFKPLGLSFLK